MNPFTFHMHNGSLVMLMNFLSQCSVEFRPQYSLYTRYQLNAKITILKWNFCPCSPWKHCPIKHILSTRGIPVGATVERGSGAIRYMTDYLIGLKGYVPYFEIPARSHKNKTYQRYKFKHVVFRYGSLVDQDRYQGKDTWVTNKLPNIRPQIVMMPDDW